MRFNSHGLEAIDSLRAMRRANTHQQRGKLLDTKFEGAVDSAQLSCEEDPWQRFDEKMRFRLGIFERGIDCARLCIGDASTVRLAREPYQLKASRRSSPRWLMTPCGTGGCSYFDD